MKENLNAIKKLRSQRYSYKAIGLMFGVSKQRIHQIYKGYYAGSSKYASFNKFIETYKACKVCGISEKLEVHHKDGNKRNNEFSNLERLCLTHHREAERFLYRNKLKPTEYNRGGYKKCKICSKDIWVVPAREKTQKYCSQKCHGLGQKLIVEKIA